MATFQYIAKDADGQESRGTVDATDRSAAIMAVKAMGLRPTALGEVKTPAPGAAAAGKGPAKGKGGKPEGKGLHKEINLKMPSFLQGRVKTAVLSQFTRQLATLVTAGMPLMRGLKVLERQTTNSQLKTALGGIAEHIASGGTFSEGLVQYPKIFDDLYVNMVKAGEAGGVLEVVLARLAEFAEKADRIRNKVKSAMIYPCVVLFAAIGITAFLLVVVIPKFKQVFNEMLGGQSLPLVTEFVLSASSFVEAYGGQIVASVFALIVLYKLIGRTKRGRYLFDYIKLQMPVTGTLAQRSAVSKFSRTLGTLLHSGVPILQSLTITRDTTGNLVLSKAIQAVHDAVKEGDSMTQPLSQCKVFPPMVVSMVEVGEETGAMAEMLSRVANTYDDEVDNAVAGMTAAIEPALIIVLAVIVGTIVVAMFMPMVKIIGSVSGGAS